MDNEIAIPLGIKRIPDLEIPIPLGMKWILDSLN